MNDSAEHPLADRGLGLDRLRASLSLDSPVTSVKQVSAARAQVLATSMGVETVRDLLCCYPRRYIDLSQVCTIQQAVIGSQCTLAAKVHEVKRKNPRPRLSLVEVSLVDDTGVIIATCFNQPWMADRLKTGMDVTVAGKVEFNYGFKRMTNPLIETRQPGDEVQGKVLPIHPACAKLSRNLVGRVASNAASMIRGCYDPLPLSLRRKYRLYSRSEALRAVHQPESMNDAQQARRRLRYEELFFLELDLLKREQERSAGAAPFSHTVEGAATEALRSQLPFCLTEDQAQAVQDILSRMAQPSSMNHLLLGDVGTGKTVVACFALVAAAQSGNQAMLMGPTEVLVSQYGNALGGLLDFAGITWAVLTGSTPTEQRATIVDGFRSGSIQVLFGTHALLSEDVVPNRCSLVCIDEQQRFGVEQRQALVGKAPGCDVLSLTATPIPRSLALALYGGLSLSYLHQAPSQQRGRTTKVCHFSEEGIAYDALRQAIARGEQAYVVCPLIGVKLPEPEKDVADEASMESMVEYATVEWGIEHDDLGDTLAAATTHMEVLQSQVVPQAKVALLHGKMQPAEKERVMRRFREGEIDVLVSTTVIEVGVDVPNATVMIVEDADRFGLAQLHQLRGRVGRGSLQGQVFLVSRTRAPQAMDRLRAMEATEDGFALSERDLSMRREGDIFGDRQHGRTPLRLVNVVRDKAVIEAAYQDARSLFDPAQFSDGERTLALRELQVFRKARKH